MHNPEAVADLYEDCAADIEKISRNFARRHGGEQEELAGEARLHFIRAYLKYDGGRGDFYGYTRFFIKKNLLERARLMARRNKKRPRETVDLNRVQARRPGLLEKVLAEVTEDAKTIIELTIGGGPWERATKQVNRRRALYDHLLGIGWTPNRIIESFCEIIEALS